MSCSLSRWLFVPTCLAMLVAVPPPASAQAVSAQWPGLSASGLQTVYLLDRSGTETSGKLLALNQDSLLLLVDGSERRFEMADVTRIQKRDSLKNGTLIGAAVGVALGLIASGISDCPGDDPGGSCGGVRAVAVATSVGVYAGLGAGLDALIRGRTTLYTAPLPLGSHVSMSALSNGAAIRVGFSW